MQSAILPNESVIQLHAERQPEAEPRPTSGFWGLRHGELEGVELAAAIALVVHRGVLPQPERRCGSSRV